MNNLREEKKTTKVVAVNFGFAMVLVHVWTNLNHHLCELTIFQENLKKIITCAKALMETNNMEKHKNRWGTKFNLYIFKPP